MCLRSARIKVANVSNRSAERIPARLNVAVLVLEWQESPS